MTACVRETHDEKSCCYEERIRTAFCRRSGKYWMHILLIIQEIVSICSVSRTTEPQCCWGTSKWGVDLDEWYLYFDSNTSFMVSISEAQKYSHDCFAIFVMTSTDKCILTLITLKPILFLKVWSRKVGGGQNVTCSKTQSRHDKDRWMYFIYFYLWFRVTNYFSSSVLWQPTVFQLRYAFMLRSKQQSNDYPWKYGLWTVHKLFKSSKKQNLVKNNLTAFWWHLAFVVSLLKQDEVY